MLKALKVQRTCSMYLPVDEPRSYYGHIYHPCKENSAHLYHKQIRVYRQKLLLPRMYSLGLLWPEDLTVISSLISSHFPKIPIVEKQNSLCRETLDFETTIMFLSLAKSLSLKWIIVISNQCLYSDIIIWVTTNEALHSSFPLLLVSGFTLLTVQYWLGHYLRKVSHRICSSSL